MKSTNSVCCEYRPFVLDFFIHSRENVSERRQRGRFAGFSLYVSNTGDTDGSSLCYKHGPKLPFLNFSTTCITSGRYVIFYNERLDGVTYPTGYEYSIISMELCDVAVNGK